MLPTPRRGFPTGFGLDLLTQLLSLLHVRVDRKSPLCVAPARDYVLIDWIKPLFQVGDIPHPRPWTQGFFAHEKVGAASFGSALLCFLGRGLPGAALLAPCLPCRGARLVPKFAALGVELGVRRLFLNIDLVARVDQFLFRGV